MNVKFDLQTHRQCIDNNSTMGDDNGALCEAETSTGVVERLLDIRARAVKFL